MFFHTMKYTLLNLLRDKGQVFWCVAFPLLLGTMFHFAFGGLGSGESFSAIPVAVVMQEESSELRSMLDSLSKPGEDQFLEVTYASAADAKELLKAKEVYGIITADLPTVSDYRNAASAKDVSTYPLSLTLSADDFRSSVPEYFKCACGSFQHRIQCHRPGRNERSHEASGTA